jgi:hypothetical protein
VAKAIDTRFRDLGYAGHLLLEIDAYMPDVRNAAAILHPHLAKL